MLLRRLDKTRNYISLEISYFI